MASFPLLCLLCSKSHVYSDISHLLTHVSSKAHLAAHFNASVRGPQDPALDQKLKEYNQWFTENNLAELLKERLSRKDERKSGIRTTQVRTRGARGRRGRKSSAATTRQRRIKKDPDQEEDAAAFDTFTIDPSTVPKKEDRFDAERYPPNGHENISRAISLGVNIKEELLSEQEDYHHTWHPNSSIAQDDFGLNDGSGYHWTALSDSPHHGFTSRASFDFESPPESRVTNSKVRAASISQVVDENGDEHHPAGKSKGRGTKLKGVIWPGMNLFDAASPDSKRTRNQPKNYEVSSTLERLTEQFQPIEVIYYAGTWDFKEDRIINGKIQSPPPSGLPTPKRKRNRRALIDKNPNQKIEKVGSQKLTDRDNGELIKQESGEDVASFHGYHRETSAAYTLERPRLYPGQERSGFEAFHASLPYLDGQLSTYPIAPEYSFIRADHLPKHTSSSVNHYQPGSHCLLAPHPANQSRQNSHQVHIQTRPESMFEPSDAQAVHELMSGSCNGCQHIAPDMAYTRFAVPPLDNTAFSRPMFREPRQNSSLDNSLTRAPNYNLGEQDHRNCCTNGLQRTSWPGSNIPSTPTRTARPSARFGSTYGNFVEESSGDETIDQGIDSSPVRYQTRSTTRTIDSGHHGGEI